MFSSSEDSELVASAIGFVADLHLVFLDYMFERQGLCKDLISRKHVELSLVEERQ